MIRVLIVEARFYDELAAELLAGAITELEGQGVTHEKISVPGALEIPQVIAMAAKSGHFDGAVALGCVIQGETRHYDIVAGQSARALMDIAIQNRFPVGNGILTTENTEQAMARARRNRGNKGASAARACLDVIAAKSQLAAANG